MRSLKKAFQSREVEVEAEVLEAMSEAVAADVEETWRHSEGVKNDVGVVVGGLLLFDKVGRDEESWRALEDTCRFGASV